MSPSLHLVTPWQNPQWDLLLALSLLEVHFSLQADSNMEVSLGAGAHSKDAVNTSDTQRLWEMFTRDISHPSTSPVQSVCLPVGLLLLPALE